MKLRYILLFFAIYTPLQAAESLSFVIGNDETRIKIVIPDQYCLLDINRPSDSRVLTTFDLQAKGKHKRLVFMVNCKQLTEWRNGDLITFDDFGYVLMPDEHIDRISDKLVDEFLNGMIEEIGHDRSNTIRHRGDGYLEKYIEERVTELEHSASVDLGLIHRDNVALYTASLDKITTEIGEQTLSGKVTAITQVKGKPLFFYWARKLDNLKTIEEIEAALSKWVANIHQVN